MLLNLAWRNLWRNKRRSVIVLISVAIGVIATVLLDTLSRGMVYQILDNQVGSHVTHMQIHRKGFHKNPVIQNSITRPEIVREVIESTSGISQYSARVVTFGLLSSAGGSSGAFVVGVDPEREQALTTIQSSIVRGSYLSGQAHEIVIGKTLAEKLEVELGDRVVAMASAKDGHVGSELFRIVGMFETFSSEFDKSSVYVPRSSAQTMLGLGGEVSEFALLMTNIGQITAVEEALKERLGSEYEVLPYMEILPLLVLQIEVFDQSMIIFYVIIGIALIFGIINTMLMSVFERIREFGVLKAIGMKDGRLLLMVLTEAFLLGIIGTAAGFVVGYLTYLPLAESGLDLSMFSEGLRSFGVGAIIYPVMTAGVIVDALCIIPIVAVVGAIYPAVRATRLEPVEAIRYV
ncbi:MAG TPA: FtsX-like permease family protein [Bacteroidota bacterium]